jgi:hypothetical protein
MEAKGAMGPVVVEVVVAEPAQQRRVMVVKEEMV